MQPPTVRTLDQLRNESNAIFDPQRANINAQVTAAGSRLNTAQVGLDAAKTNAFGEIDSTAARRGALFGGFTPNAQAKYTAEKFLPSIANLYAQNEATVQGLNTDLVNSESEQNKMIIGQRDQDQGKLDEFNQVQEERKFQTEQANQAYQREMEKLRADQAFQASQNALTRQAQAPNQADKLNADRGATATSLSKVTGKDGFVSPQSYQKAKAAWTSLGYSGAQFDSYYGGFRNPANKNYKLG